MNYETSVVIESGCFPGVKFRISKMSFGRRLELTKRVRDLSQRIEFHAAGEDAREKIEAALLSREIDKIYLEWGLEGIEGLDIDGKPVSVELLIQAGPEGLCREILDAIKAECRLTEADRKN